MRRTIYADSEGRYTARSIIPSGYGVPEGPPPMWCSSPSAATASARRIFTTLSLPRATST
ncbi:hypothetical protein [Halomonas sp. KX33721]|nr:hypothetical protein [Halomonas sp. KX33721]